MSKHISDLQRKCNEINMEMKNGAQQTHIYINSK
jgi:hypothetical protein